VIASAMAAVRAGLRAALELRFRPNRDTAVAFALGLLVIGISAILPLFTADAPGDTIAYVLLRDVIMVAGLGFLVPIYYTLFVKKRGAGELGFTKKKWLASLIIGLALGVFFLLNFVGEAGQEGQSVFLDAGAISPVFYLMLVGAFEVVFFYVFLRQQFEEAFGVLPALALAAAFYSLHHAGFQPEFVKLFFVGLIYAATFRLTLNLLAVYPFFWGVGGCWDVLVMSDAVAGSGILNSAARGLLLLALMAAALACVYWKSKGTKAAGRPSRPDMPAAKNARHD
jgi:magnesium-transporting ATPase (P-type)